MATEYLFSNNATTTLAQSVSATATVLNVASGTGSMFPSPGQGQAFAVTLVDAATGLTNEICYCTSRSGDQLTVVRGREGTNATTWQAGDTCANYITADVMESWLQESDLDGYATQSWADSRYVRSPLTPSLDNRVSYIGMNKSSGQVYASVDNGPLIWLQPAGDYATNTALQAEASSRASADTNLQNQINDRVLKTGDTSTGSQYSSGWFWGGYNAGFGGGTEIGSLRWTSFGVAFGNPFASTNYSFAGNICVSDMIGNVNDNSSGINMRGYDYQGTLYNWFFAWNGNITTPKGLVAFQSDLQNYVSQSQYSNDFATSDSRVINLAWGHKIQAFTATGPNITFPQAFSSDAVIVVARQTNSDLGETQYTYDITSTGCKIGGSSLYSFIVIGPK